MRHMKVGKSLSRTASHRKAMFANLAVSLFDKERVITTVVKAKEVRRFVERLISYAKQGTLHATRLAARYIHDKDILKKLFTVLGPCYKDRPGGYTRVIKYKNRKGDNAQLAILELVGREGDIQRKRKKRKKGAAQKVVPETKEQTTEVAETVVENKVDNVDKAPEEAQPEKPKEVKAKPAKAKSVKKDTESKEPAKAKKTTRKAKTDKKETNE